ncbi:MAG: hypothetical protein F4X64_07245 [Chloroflexi bacterium]|nr:hypothetical protein [Chloroflexota bacterium]
MVMAKHIRGRLIAGKRSAFDGAGTTALGIYAMVAVLLATGCAGEGGGASGAGDWLAYVPGDARMVAILDNQPLRSGDVPEDYAEYFDEEFGGSGEIYDFLGVSENDLIAHAVALVGDLGGRLTILRGSFDFDIIRGELEGGRGCGDSEYRGFELWECAGQDYAAVALFEKERYVVLVDRRQSDLEDILRYKSQAPEKLANTDDSDIKRLLDRTDGWWQIAFLEYPCFEFERCEGLAIALGRNSDSATMPASYAVLFNSEHTATAAEGNSEIDELFHEAFFWLFHVALDVSESKAEGEFVVGSGTAKFLTP